MSIEQTIYDRLQPVTANVYPDTPTENTGLPFVVYRVSGTEPQLHTQGVSAITKYTVEVDAYAENKAEVSALQGSVRTQLHGYRGGSIQGAFLQSESGEEIELGYHGQQTFVVWASTANVTATTDSTGSVQTGPNSVSLSACEHTLTLDCDGLRLDGGPVGQTPDLTPYARLDVANTFTQPQTVKTPLTIGNLSSEDPVITWTPVAGQTGIRLKSGNTEVARFQDNGQARFVSFGTNGGFNIFDFGIQRGGGDGFVRFDGTSSPAVRIGGTAGGSYTSVVRLEGTTTTVPVLVVRGVAAQTADLEQWQNSSGTALTKIDSNGGIVPASMSNATAANGTLYYSTDAGKLVFKDGGGVVNNLY